MTMFSRTLKDFLLILIPGTLFFFPFLGGVHLFDWDEINFAEISREMIVTGNYLRPQVNFQPFWEKPPLFFWLQVLSMKVFGINEFSARFPNALTGLASLLVLYAIGKKIYNRRFGLIWAMAYGGSILPHLYFRSGIIDPVFNLFIFLGLYFFILFYWKKEDLLSLRHGRGFYMVLSGFFIGLAVLTKGPVGYLIPLLAWGVYWVWKKFRFYVSVPGFVGITSIALIATVAWFGIETVQHGTWFMETFIRYQIRLFSTQDAGHGGFPGYHFVVILLGCFPSSIFAIRAFYRFRTDTGHLADFRVWMIILFWVVLILFSIVQSKIVHYSSMAYFPLTFLAALSIDRILDKQIYVNRWMRAGIIVVGGIYAVLTALLPLAGRRIESIKPLFSKDPFAMANLEAGVHWTGMEAAAGIMLAAVIMFSVMYLRQGRLGRGIILLFGGTAIFVNLTLYLFIGRIEGYSQHAAVEFCKSLQGKDCYVITSGYKSYVQYFYPRIMPYGNPKYTDKDWLFRGDIDKDVYILTKVNKTDVLNQYPDIVELGSKNGFVFFKRSHSGRSSSGVDE